MLKLAALALALVAGTASPALAQSSEFSSYDATRATSVAERLVLCDLADQLSNGAPSRDATRSYVQAEGTGRFELALPPDFTRPSGWYDYDIERAYDRFRRAGQVRRDEVHAARERFRTPLRGRFDRLRLADQRFFQGQARFCGEMIRASRRL